jgi:hypothetical protein
MNRILLLCFVCVAAALSSCEEVIQANITGSRPVLCVDAFINNDTTTQKITLTLTSSYLNNAAPQAATGATVQLTDLANRVFNFTDPDNDGVYECKQPVRTADPLSRFPIGVPGNVYQLTLTYQGETYRSIAKMDSVPPIDSLGFEAKEQEVRGPDTLGSGYVLTMVAKDLPGQTNGYWLKSFRNGVFFSKPGNMNLAYDGAYSQGSDGVQFIVPIVFGLSPERFQKGDVATVEIHSIGIPTFGFLSIAQNQMTVGGPFSAPLVNCPSNIINSNPNSKAKAVGWFCAAAISRKSITIAP